MSDFFQRVYSKDLCIYKLSKNIHIVTQLTTFRFVFEIVSLFI
jgi:hypothetical protein